MKITERGVMAAIVRDGDYLVFRSDRNGTSVEYSPGAAQGARVIGAFAAHKGRVKFFEEPEASSILQNFAMNAEEHLVADLEGPEPWKEKSLTDKVVDALLVYADAGYAHTTENPKWDGRLSEFHKEVLFPSLGVPYSTNLIRAVQRASARIPGIVLSKLDGERFITVEWAALKLEN